MWLLEDKEFKPTPDELSSWVGFVYEILDTANGMKYIGKKNFWSTRRLPPLKGKSRKRVIVKEFEKNVLFDPNYYNEFIGLKCHSKHVSHLALEMINGRR